MRRLVWILSLVTALAAVAPRTLVAQDGEVVRTFRRLEEPNGLSHNSVYAILQDDLGFLWFGTADGLNRFDGYEFEVLRVPASESRGSLSSVIASLLQDDAGRIWVGTLAGLARVDREAGVLRRVPLGGSEDEPTTVATLVQTTDRRVWIGTDRGLYVIEPGAAEPTGWILPEEVGLVSDLEQDESGRLWLLEPGDGAARAWYLDRSSWQGPVALPHEWRNARTFTIDSRGRFWGDGLSPVAVVDLLAGTFAVESSEPAGVWTLDEDRDGAIWIGTAAGLVRRGGDDNELTRFLLDRRRSGLIFEHIRALLVDDAGTIWVGTHGGIYRSDPRWKRFVHLDGRLESGWPLTSPVVSAIAEDPDDPDTIWLGTLGGGVNVVDLKATNESAVTVPGGFPEVVWDLGFDTNGGLWVASASGLLRRDRGASGNEKVDFGDRGRLPMNTRDLEIDVDGIVWAATVDGLFRVRPTTLRAERVFPMETRDGLSVESVAVSADGAVWAGDIHGTLHRFEPTTGRTTPHELRGNDGSRLMSEGIWALHVDSSGTVWAGSGAGLTSFDPKSGTYRHFATGEGLPGSVVYSIVESGDSPLWLGTNQGIVQIDAGAEPRTRVFTERDGVGSTEFNRHAALRGSNGRLYFGGVNGLTYFHPSRIAANTLVPPVVITSVQAASREGVVELLAADTDSIALSHRDTSVSFEFTALSYTNPEAHRYAFRMEGLDDDWIDNGNRRFARYTSLPPGSYTFRVRAANEDGVWNEEGDSVAVRVIPPFWGTTWFRTAALGVIGLSVWGAHRLRVRHLLAIEGVRRQIAGDLHDDLGSDLSAMALTAEALRDAPPDPAEVEAGLSRLTGMARRLSNEVRDIVWIVDPGNDSIADLVFRMRETAGQLLHGTEHRFEVDGADVAGHTTVEVRRQVFLIFKECLNNAAKHSGAGTVRITVSGAGPELRVRVQDDGRGFVESALEHRFGLEQMRRRATAVGGTVRVTSLPGQGTAVDLRVPLT